MFQLSRKQIQVLGWILIKPFNRRINEILRTLISQDCDQFNQNGGQIVWVVLSPNKFSKHPNKLCHTGWVCETSCRKPICLLQISGGPAIVPQQEFQDIKHPRPRIGFHCIDCHHFPRNIYLWKMVIFHGYTSHSQAAEHCGLPARSCAELAAAEAGWHVFTKHSNWKEEKQDH